MCLMPFITMMICWCTPRPSWVQDIRPCLEGQQDNGCGLKWEATSTIAFMGVKMGVMHVHVLSRLHKDDSRCMASRMVEYAMDRLCACLQLRHYLQDLDVLFIGEYGK